jgi:hypothetical protein
MAAPTSQTTERVRAELSYSHLTALLRDPAGDPLSVRFDLPLRTRLMQPPGGHGLLMGLHLSGQHEHLHLFGVRGLNGVTAEELGATLSQFQKARQLTRTEGRSEILGYYSTAVSSEGRLNAEEEQFVQATPGVRVVVSRSPNPDALWIRINQRGARPLLMDWPSVPQSGSMAAVPEAMAALSQTQAAAQIFRVNNDALRAAAGRRKSLMPWLAIVVVGIMALAAGTYYLARPSAPQTAQITITETPLIAESGMPAQPGWSPIPVVQRPVPAPVQMQQPVLQTAVTPPAERQAPRQLDLSQLERRGPQGGVGPLEEPAPGQVAPVAGVRTAPIVGSLSNSIPRPAPPPPPKPEPAVEVQAPPPASYVPPRSTRKTAVSLPPDVLRQMPDQATVMVSLRLDETGKVVGATPQSNSGGVNAYVSSFVANSLRSWQFAPATLGGKPVPSSTSVAVTVKRPR